MGRSSVAGRLAALEAAAARPAGDPWDRAWAGAEAIVTAIRGGDVMGLEALLPPPEAMEGDAPTEEIEAYADRRIRWLRQAAAVARGEPYRLPDPDEEGDDHPLADAQP